MSRIHFRVVIPARFGSSRLPGKALADIAGKPMVVRVAERARDSGADGVIVATDHEGVRDAVVRHGFDAIMTRRDHPSGTDRIAEVSERLALDPDAIVLNVQGDEPLIEPGLIRAVATLLAETPEAAIATACHPIRVIDDFLNANVVKVVLDREGYARYFSRAPIPWARDAFGRSMESLPAGMPCYRHIGIYAFRASFLALYARLEPSPLEEFEALEQLRALWHGFPIVAAIRPEVPHPGVDTPEDLARVRTWFDRSGDPR